MFCDKRNRMFRLPLSAGRRKGKRLSSPLPIGAQRGFTAFCSCGLSLNINPYFYSLRSPLGAVVGALSYQPLPCGIADQVKP